MFCICVYDINVKRLDRIYSILRQYLCWVQNSVFEGEISKSQLTELCKILEKTIDPEEDSIVMYVLKREKDAKRILLGREKGKFNKIIW